ncbi:GNAT family N-acetyltransferase [Cetobacterium sp. SF1]|uniref:GNAT family N-acetyltransferase n=1 Tax=Cetobacterium sp. SF1 TaxID=3417654 RepID=UPI003CF93F63
MKVEIKKCQPNDGNDIYQLLCALGSGENGFELTNPENFQHFQKIINKFIENEGENQPPGRVPQEVYWLYVNDIPVGIVKIRYKLTENLLIRGGNIGYSIAPAYRSHGYGKRILQEGLKILKKNGIEKVLITANEDNIPSRKVIEFNGGVLEDIVDNHCRYWIENK